MAHVGLVRYALFSKGCDRQLRSVRIYIIMTQCTPKMYKHGQESVDNGAVKQDILHPNEGRPAQNWMVDERGTKD